MKPLSSAFCIRKSGKHDAQPERVIIVMGKRRIKNNIFKLLCGGFVVFSDIFIAFSRMINASIAIASKGVIHKIKSLREIVIIPSFIGIAVNDIAAPKIWSAVPFE